jgi:hypothetical protein
MMNRNDQMERALAHTLAYQILLPTRLGNPYPAGDQNLTHASVFAFGTVVSSPEESLEALQIQNNKYVTTPHPRPLSEIELDFHFSQPLLTQYGGPVPFSTLTDHWESAQHLRESTWPPLVGSALKHPGCSVALCIQPSILPWDVFIIGPKGFQRVFRKRARPILRVFAPVLGRNSA